MLNGTGLSGGALPRSLQIRNTELPRYSLFFHGQKKGAPVFYLKLKFRWGTRAKVERSETLGPTPEAVGY